MRFSAQSVLRTAIVPGIFVVSTSFRTTFVCIQIDFIVHIALNEPCNLMIGAYVKKIYLKKKKRNQLELSSVGE